MGLIRACPTPEMIAAENLLMRELPHLSLTKLGRWVAYSPDGCIAESDDELALFQQCQKLNLQKGKFLVARVEPDAPTTEITDIWFPHDTARGDK